MLLPAKGLPPVPRPTSQTRRTAGCRNESRGSHSTDRRMNPLAFHTAAGLEISAVDGNHIIDLRCRTLADLIKWARDSASVGATFQKAKEGPNPLSQMERKGIPRRANRDGRVGRGLRARVARCSSATTRCRRGLAGGNQAERDRAVRGTAALGAPRRLRWAVEKDGRNFRTETGTESDTPATLQTRCDSVFVGAERQILPIR